ncbi:MAG: SRPBCC family protein [Pyrinomonadaceae bacterium]|nr:SRPBCC family protein [Pyrinomonadaceae bacterium]
MLNRNLSIDLPRERVFSFFADAGNLESITPPELNFRITTPQPIEISKGTRIDYKLKIRGIPITWQTLISEWDPPFSFIDESLKSPYKQWIHQHIFLENESGGTDIEDIVRYRLPFEPLGDIAHWLVRRELDRIFDYREKAVIGLLTS